VNYYPFHIGDYLSATRHLSWEEDAAYRRLLDTYYTNEKPLPVELRAVCRLVLAQTETQREAVDVVLNEFFELTPDGWINHRADGEIEKMQALQQKQRDKANKRWQKPQAEHGNAPGMPQHEIEDAAAPKTCAGAMPPTPTPTPTPIPIPLKEEEQKIASPAAQPSPSPKAKRFDPQAHIEGLGVQPGIVSDWLALRKAKKATVTETAVSGIASEALKAGVSLEAALATCCARGWSGFKAEWLLNDKQRQQGPQGSPTSFNNRIASGAATIMRGLEQ